MLAVATSVFWHDRGFFPIDTFQVLNGVGNLDACARAHVFSNCELTGRAVGPFPFAQYGIALAAKHLGASYGTAAQVLLDLNRLAGLGVVALLAFAAQRLLPRRLLYALVLVAVSGPLLWYAESGFGEALAMFLTLAAVVSFALRWPVWLTALAVFAAGVTKETAPFFLVLMIAAVAVGRRERLPVLLPAAVGGLAAALVNGAFNVWRYGTFYNEYYAEPARLTPGISLKAQFFAGQLIAPNAGLVWFWPAATLLLAVGLYLALRHPDRHRRQGAVLLTAATVGLIALFAAYHSPYGWNALGPRYLIPWVPALCFAAALLAGDRLGRVQTSTVRTLAVGLAVAALALLEVGVFVQPLVPFHLFDDSRPPCFYVAPDVLEAYEHSNYYDCETHLAWSAHPVLLDAFKPLDTAVGLTLAPLMLVSVGLLTAAARRPEL